MIIFTTIDGNQWAWDEDETLKHWEYILDVRLRLNTTIPGKRVNIFNETVGESKNILTRSIVTWEQRDGAKRCQ